MHLFLHLLPHLHPRQAYTATRGGAPPPPPLATALAALVSVDLDQVILTPESPDT